MTHEELAGAAKDVQEELARTEHEACIPRQTQRRAPRVDAGGYCSHDQINSVYFLKSKEP